MSKYKLPSGAASIEAVVGFNTEKDYTTPISKKNIQKALMESLYVNLEQQQEIQLQNAQLLDANNEIMALKAMVECQKLALSTISDWGSLTIEFKVNFGSNGQRDYYRKIAAEAYNKTPQQCLASVKADAVESVKPIVTEELREVFDSEMLEQMKSNGVIACEDGFLLSLIATFEMIIEDHANKLREQK